MKSSHSLDSLLPTKMMRPCVLRAELYTTGGGGSDEDLMQGLSPILSWRESQSAQSSESLMRRHTASTKEDSCCARAAFCKKTVKYPQERKVTELSCQLPSILFPKGTNPNLIQSVDPLANFLEVQRTEKHIWPHHKCKILKSQTVRNYRFLLWFHQELNVKNK